MQLTKSFIFILATIFSFSAFSKTLVGKVDIQKVLVSIEEGKKVRNQLKGEFDKKQKLLKKEEDKIRKMKEDLDKQAAVLNAKAKAKKERALQEAIMQAQQKSMQYQQEIQGKEQELKKPLLDKIKTIVEAVSKKNEVDFTFESSTTPVVYAKDLKDLTDEVIKEYNSKHK